MVYNHPMGTDLGSITGSPATSPPSTWPSEAHAAPNIDLLPGWLAVEMSVPSSPLFSKYLLNDYNVPGTTVDRKRSFSMYFFSEV